MNVTILHTEDCPNLEPLLAELRTLIDGREAITLTTTLVRSVDEAMRLGFHGSPTILINGADSFPGPFEPVGAFCRRCQNKTAVATSVPIDSSVQRWRQCDWANFRGFP